MSNRKNVVSTVNLHQVDLEDVRFVHQETTSWISIGPVSIFGSGDNPTERVDDLLNILMTLRDEIKAQVNA